MEITEAVRQQAEGTIETHKDEVDSLCRTEGVSVEDVIDAWVVWDMGINEYGNEIYNSPAMRIAMHLHNYLPGNWHDKRQKKVLEFLRQVKPHTIAEVGFGTPQRYVSEYVFANDAQLTLMDFDSESLSFAETFLCFQSESWKKHVSLRKYDMNSEEDIGEFDCYIFQDSIEHADNPTEYLKKVVDSAPEHSYFIFSLPIEVDSAIPEHNIFWKDTEHACKWLEESGLTIQSVENIEMNEEFDHFAKHLHPDFKEIVVLAKK